MEEKIIVTPAAELLLNIRCVALLYFHNAIQQVIFMLFSSDSHRISIC